MRTEIKEIVHTLRDHSQPAKQKYDQIIDVLNDSLSSKSFIQALESEMNRADCLYCDKQPFCRFYITFAYYKRGQRKRSIEYIEEAIEGFRIQTMEWNEAMSHWLLGEILIDKKNYNLAQRSLERAAKILTPVILELKAKSNYDDAKRGEKYISVIQAAIERANSNYHSLDQVQAHHTAPLVKETSIPNDVSQNTNEEKGYIIFPSIPIYEEVEAGPNGHAWVDYFELGDTEVRQVILQGKAYKVYSTRYNEKFITIFSNKKYAWAKVHGQSMNACRPQPICDGDYILFHIHNQPQNNNIVVASHLSHPAAFTYMVKRYREPEKRLISETTDTSQPYPPLPVNQDYQILGIVIAVAKPE